MGFVLFVHVIVCVLLVITILMQAGRGGGLAESFSSAESMFGTQTNKFMVRFSTILAAIFLTTSLTLAVNSSHKEKSLMDNAKLAKKAATVKPPVEKAEDKVTVNVEDPRPVVTKPEAALPNVEQPVSSQPTK